MNIPHCVLLILNILFVTGYEESKLSLLKKLANENNLENIKAIIINDDVEESNNANKNNINNIRTVPLVNALRNTNKYKKKNLGKKISDDNAITIYLSGRNSTIENFLNNINGDVNSENIMHYMNKKSNSNDETVERSAFYILDKKEKYKTKVVNVTGNVDVNDPNAQSWDHIHDDIFKHSGHYKILNEDGEVTGFINVKTNPTEEEVEKENVKKYKSKEVKDTGTHRYKPEYKSTPRPTQSEYSDLSLENDFRDIDKIYRQIWEEIRAIDRREKRKRKYEERKKAIAKRKKRRNKKIRYYWG